MTKIIRVDKPLKARIDVEKDTIEVGSKFFDASKAARHFIIFHELGHRKYKNEFGADRYAKHKMLKNGYSVNDCVYALEDNLRPSKLKDERIKRMKS